MAAAPTTLQAAAQRPVQVPAHTAAQKTVQLIPRKTTAAGGVVQEDGGDPLRKLPPRAVAPEQPRRGDLTGPPTCVQLLWASTSHTGQGCRSATRAPNGSRDA